MTVISQLKDKLKAMGPAAVDRVLWQLRIWCIEEVGGYAEYRGQVMETTATGTARQEKKNLEEVAALSSEKFRKRRLEVIAEEQAAEQLQRWQTNRVGDGAKKEALRALFQRPA